MKITQIVTEINGQKVIFSQSPRNKACIKVANAHGNRIVCGVDYKNTIEAAHTCYAHLHGHPGTRGDAQEIVAIFNALAEE